MIVVKVGGGKGINLDTVCADVATLVKGGEQVVLVHGGSDETNILSERLGKPPRFVTSVSGMESRYTDRETLEIFAMVYAGKVNTIIVEKLQQQGVNAVGLSGVDGRLLEGPRKPAIKIIENGVKQVLRDDYTGKVEQVNTGLLTLLLENGYTPAISPPALSTESEAINVDGDRAAAMIAVALKARRLVILSNVPGLLRDIDDPTSLIPAITRAEIEHSMDFAKGRMKKKVLGAIEALRDGVSEVIFADSRHEQPIQRALQGQGTVFR